MSPEAFVVDNSVVMAWLFEDEGSRYAMAALEALERAAAFVPSIWPLEVGNVLLVAERKKRLNETSSLQFLEALGGLPITVEVDTAGRAFGEIISLAREHRLSTYDAAYLDLAMRLGVAIATQDADLAKAAKKAGVRLYQPGKV